MSQYNNTLDTWYQECPWPVQRVLEWPYQKISEGLRWVTGDPDKVAGQAPTYDDIARQIEQISSQVSSTSNGIGLWEGPARDAFKAKMKTLEDNLNSLAPAVARTREILEAAAETSVEAANMILDIVRSVIEFLLSSLAIAVATSVLTAGASALAWVAANMAKGAQALAKVMQGLSRVAQVLQKLASLLDKISKIFEKVAEILKGIKELLKIIKELKKGATLVEKAILTGAAAVIKAPINYASNKALDGVSSITGVPGLSMPGGVGEAKKAGEDAIDAIGASNEAVDAANR